MPSTSKLCKGEILRIFQSGTHGFIWGEDHRRYLFRHDDLRNCTMHDLKEGTPVRFDGFDDGMGDRAANVYHVRNDS